MWGGQTREKPRRFITLLVSLLRHGMVWSTVKTSAVMMLPALEIIKCDFKNGCSFVAGMVYSEGKCLERFPNGAFEAFHS